MRARPVRSARVPSPRFLERLRAAWRALVGSAPHGADVRAGVHGIAVAASPSSRIRAASARTGRVDAWIEPAERAIDAREPTARAAKSVRSTRSTTAAVSSRTVIPHATPRFSLAVDDAGEFLVVVGESATIGHVRAHDVDLPFLADIGAHHARLDLVEDFHTGARWRVAPESDAHVEVNGRAIGATGALLADGNEVRLAPNLAFRFVARERGSSSARLELSGGNECLGAPRILLFAPGPGGRVRIGAGASRSVPLADLEHEIELAAERTPGGASVSVRCCAGVAPVTPAAASEPEVRIALPLALAITLTARARGPQKPPFALIFRSIHPSGGAALEG